MEKKTYLRMIKDNQLVTDFAGGDDNLLSKLENDYGINSKEEFKK